MDYTPTGYPCHHILGKQATDSKPSRSVNVAHREDTSSPLPESSTKPSPDTSIEVHKTETTAQSKVNEAHPADIHYILAKKNTKTANVNTV